MAISGSGLINHAVICDEDDIPSYMPYQTRPSPTSTDIIFQTIIIFEESWQEKISLDQVFIDEMGIMRHKDKEVPEVLAAQRQQGKNERTLVVGVCPKTVLFELFEGQMKLT